MAYGAARALRDLDGHLLARWRCGTRSRSSDRRVVETSTSGGRTRSTLSAPAFGEKDRYVFAKRVILQTMGAFAFRRTYVTLRRSASLRSSPLRSRSRLARPSARVHLLGARSRRRFPPGR